MSVQSWSLMDVSLATSLREAGGEAEGRGSHRGAGRLCSLARHRGLACSGPVSGSRKLLSREKLESKGGMSRGTQALPGTPLRVPADASLCHMAASRHLVVLLSEVSHPPRKAPDSQLLALIQFFLADTASQTASGSSCVLACSSSEILLLSIWLLLLLSSTRNGKTNSSLLTPWSDY